MVTRRFIQRDGKTFGPYYYESYRDSSGKVKKRYLKDYSPQKENASVALILTVIGVLAIFFLFILLLNQEYSHSTLTGRAIYEAKEIYSPGEQLTGDILFNLREGESIPKDTKVKISLGDFQEEFVLSDFVDYQPVEGTIYAENSQLSGEGMVFGIPGTKKDYQEVEVELEIYTEQETEEPQNPAPVEENTNQNTETTEEPQTPENVNSITGQAITEIPIKTISGKVSKNSPFTYELEAGQKARISSVKSDGKDLSKEDISLDVKDNVLTVTTDYAADEKGFGQDYLGEENAMTFKINIADLNLKATPGDLIIEISYGEEQIAYYKDTILVSDTEEPKEELQEPTLTQTKDIPSIRIPAEENVVIDMNDYFTGATSYSVQIENIQADIENNLIKLTPDEDFKGARKARIIAKNDKETLESNEFLILVSSGAVSIKTTREKIVLGQPVKWKKEITKEQAEEKINIEIPAESENVEVKTLVDNQEQTVEEIPQASPLTGNVVIEVKLQDKNQVKLSPNFVKSFKSWFASFKSQFSRKLQMPEVTGKTVEEIPSPSEVVDVTLDEPGATQYVVEYETPAPQATEQSTENGKTITISAPDYGYTDVVAFTNLDNTIPAKDKEKIKLYWHNYEYSSLSQQELQEAKTTKASEVPETQVVEEISTSEESPVMTGEVVSTQQTSTPDYKKEEVSFDSYDLNEDGFIDYVEWVVPHLSNQTYELIIEISNAEHLDENRTFVSDIYNNVSVLDNIWSETIPENHFVRATFQTELASNNDITIFPRTISGTPQIEVYEENSNETIAVFSHITDNEYNKVYLTSLQNPQKTFDLKVVNGAIELDHIIDPLQSTLCYQESANVSTACGGLANGTYANGSYWNYVLKTYDGNWNTYGNASAETVNADLYINYSKPANAQNSSKLRVRFKTDILYDLNLTIPSECWNTDPLRFNIEIFKDPFGTVSVYCYNSTNSRKVMSSSGGDTIDDLFYEEAMWWNITQDINDTNPPSVNFTDPTPADGSSQSSNSIYVNVSSNDSSDHYVFVNFDSSLIGWWRMDKNSSIGENATKVYDWSGNGNNATVVGNATFNSSGRFGGAYVFPGQDTQQISISHNELFNTGTYTLSAWVITNSSNEEIIIEKRITTAGYPYSLRVLGTGVVQLYVYNGTYAASVQSTTKVNDNKWHHIVATREINGNTTVYIDSASGNSNMTDMSGSIFNSNELLFGSRYGNRQLNGTLDEILIFNRSLSASEVASLYNASAYQYSNSFNSLSEGAHTIRAFAVDAYGNLNQTEIRTITIQGTNITACGTLSQDNAVYTLAQNITATGTCIVVMANNITINGNGNNIDYCTTNTPIVDYYGVISYGNETTIKNLTITKRKSGNTNYAIKTTGKNGRIENVRAYNNSVDFNIAGTNTTILNSGAYSRGNHFVISGSNNSVFNIIGDEFGPLTINPPGTAITISGSGHLVQGADVRGNTGISLTDSSGIIIQNVTITDTGNAGVSMVKNENSSLTDLTIVAMSGTGLSILNSSYVNITNSTISQGSTGILIDSDSLSNRITGINITDTTDYAIYIANANNSVIQNLFVYNNPLGDSIVINGGSYNQIINGIINESGPVSVGPDYPSYDNRLANLTFINNPDASITIYSNSQDTVLEDLTTANTYSIPVPGAKITVRDTRFGEIKFLQSISSNYEQNFTADFKILSNFAYVNSSKTGFDKSANITLYNIPTFTHPRIFKDNSICTNCYNFTPLNGTAVFNVTSWSSYSIGEYDTTPPIPTVVFPVNNSNYNNEYYCLTHIDRVVTNKNTSWCGVSRDGSENMSMIKVNETTFQLGVCPNNGPHYVVFTCNDTSNNIASSPRIDFTFDLTIPTANFIYPTPADGSAQSSDSIYVNFSTFDNLTHYSFVDFDDSLILWMRMDDTNGTGEPTDLSHYSNNGTKKGNATQADPGIYGRAFDFNGNYGYVEVPSLANNTMQENRSYSVSLWVKIKNESYNGMIISDYYGWGDPQPSGQAGWDIEFDTGVAYYRVYNTTDEAEISFDAIPINEWAHLAIIQDQSSVRLYKNGVEQATAEIPKISYNGNRKFSIGARYQDSAFTKFINGSVDELLIFNRSLSSAEIAALYNASANQYHNSFINLAQGRHNFQGFAIDAAGNKNQTEVRTIIRDLTPPNINITYPTPADETNQIGNSAYVNLTTSDNSSHYSFVDFDQDLTLWMRMEGITNYIEDDTENSYSYTGSCAEPWNFFDENWSTKASIPTIQSGIKSCVYTITYNAAPNAYGAMWESKGNTSTVSWITGKCYNGTGWEQILYKTNEFFQTNVSIPFSCINRTTLQLQWNETEIISEGEQGQQSSYEEKVWWNTSDLIADNSSHEYKGIVIGNLTQQRGKFGETLSFNGNGEYVSFPQLNNGTHYETLDNRYESYSISLWVKINSNDNAIISDIVNCRNDGDIICIIPQGPIGWALFTDEQSNLTYVVGNSSSATITSRALSIGEWHHIVLIDRGETAYSGNNFTIYLDGQLIENFARHTKAHIQQRRFNVGFYSEGTKFGPNEYYLNGSVDELLIFNRTLTSQEVAALYNASANQYHNNFTNLRLGGHDFRGFAVDTAGNTNQTELRTLTITQSDTTPPEINFTYPTPANGSTQSNNNIYVNLTTFDNSTHYAFTDFDRDLLFWMRMDEFNSNSATVYDNSTYGFNGAVSGQAAQTLGKFGYAFSFDGTGFDSISGSGPEFHKNQYYTWVFWLKPTASDTNFRSIISKGDTLTSGYQIYYSQNKVSLQDQYDSMAMSSNDSVYPNNWTQVAIIYEPNCEGAEFYLNGVQDTITSNPVPLCEDDVSSQLLIGTGNSIPAFNGLIDEVMIFNRSLSSTEIAALYNASANQYRKDFTSLSNGNHTFRSFAVDAHGNINQTELREISIVPGDTTPPGINFTYPTPANGSTQSNNNIYVNLTTFDNSTHYAFTDFDSDVLLWMRMDDMNSSGSILDLSGYGNDGINSTRSYQVSNGYFGKGFEFIVDNPDDYTVFGGTITVANKSSLFFNASRDYTWSVWIYPRSFREVIQAGDSTGGIFMKCQEGDGYTPATGYSIGINHNGSIYFENCHINQVEGNSGICTASHIQQNTWQHLIIAYHYGNVSVYVNGSLMCNLHLQYLPGDDYQSNLIIGESGSLVPQAGDWPSWFNGTIDEFMIFNRSLSSAEIASLYNASANQYRNNFTNLSLGTHSFRGFAVDASGNANQTELRSVTITPAGATLLSACQTLNQSDTTYQFSGNITANYDCFIVTANNVTIDMAGYNLTDENDFGGGYGFVVNANNTAIKNGNIFNFDGGAIKTLNSYNMSIANISYSVSSVSWSTGNTKAISVVGGQSNTLLNITIRGLKTGNTYNCYGIEIINSTNNLLQYINVSNIGNQGTLQSYGVYVYNGQNNTLKDVVSEKIGNQTCADYTCADSEGIYYRSANGTLINITSTNSGIGFEMIGSSNTVINLTVKYNSQMGILLNGLHNYLKDLYVLGQAGTLQTVYLSGGQQNNTLVNVFVLGNNNYPSLQVDSNNGLLVNVSYRTNGMKIVGSNNTIYGGVASNLGSNYAIRISGSGNIFNNISLTGVLNALNFEARTNDTTFVDMLGVNAYTFSQEQSAMKIIKTGVGEIKFLESISGSGSNFSSDVAITYNLTQVRSDLNSGLNKSANITLYGLSSFASPTVLRNGQQCPAGECHLFAQSNGTVVFNVTSWTNYSIGEQPRDSSSTPLISYIQPTPNDNSLIENNLTIAVSITTYNSSTIDTVRYRIYNSTFLLFNETYTSSTNLTFYNLPPEVYTFNVWANDSLGRNVTSSDRTVTIIRSCFNLRSPAQCIEDQTCVIEEACYLHSGMCSNNVCDFTIMITNSTIYTLYDNNGNGRNLVLNLTSNTQRAPLVFLNRSSVVFSGRAGSDLGSGSQGGNAGIVNITVPDLFNTTRAVFVGQGGYTTQASLAGGNGGVLQLNFRGLILNFTNTIPATPAPVLTAGDSVSGGFGLPGKLIYNKDISCINGIKDTDINGDGRVSIADTVIISNHYNNVTNDTGFDLNYDIKCDGKLNIIDTSKIGFEYRTREIIP